MPIARRSLGAASLVAALNFPAVPAAAATSCTVSGFTARSQADLARIAVLDPGPLAPDLPALADVRLAVARGAADSTGRPHKTVATGRYADARILGIPLTDAAAVHRAPSRHPGPAGVDLADIDARGLATVKVGKATAAATWDDLYRCGKVGALTRSATMLGGVAVLDGVVSAVDDVNRTSRRTSMLKIGPAGSTQSATDLVRVAGGRLGVRAGAGVALGDLSLFAGTPQEVAIRVISQPTLEVTAAADPRQSTVDYRPAVLEVSTGGKTVSTLRDAGADLSLSLIGKTSARGPAALAVRLSVGRARHDISGRQVRAEASALRVEVKLGRTHLLDVALGHLSVEACAPARGRVVEPPVPTPVVTHSPSPSGSRSPAAPVDEPGTPGSPPASPSPDQPAAGVPAPQPPVAVGAPVSHGGGTGGGELALTGANVAVVGFGGAGLVLAGVVAMVLGRRRRQ